jgi:hypothetical protein
MNPSELEIGFKIRGTFQNEIFASDVLLMIDAVTTTRIPKQNRSIWTDQPQS